MPKFYPVKVRSVKKTTPDCTLISLEIDAELHRAGQSNDLGAIDALQHEKEQLRENLTSNSFCGRPRSIDRARKRVVDRVRNALDRAIASISKYAPDAGAHFDNAISRGATCSYSPIVLPEWEL